MTVAALQLRRMRDALRVAWCTSGTVAGRSRSASICYALSVALTEMLELLAVIDGDSSCAKSGGGVRGFSQIGVG